MLFFKLLLYIILIIPDVVEINTSENNCGCIKLIKEYKKLSKVFINKDEFISSKINNKDFFLRLDKCYTYLLDWRTNGLGVSILRSTLSITMLLRGNSLMSYLVLLTRFIPMKKIKEFFKENNYA